jgi:hypothetical protein
LGVENGGLARLIFPTVEKFLLPTAKVPLYEQGVKYSAQGAMDHCRLCHAPKTARFYAQAGRRFRFDTPAPDGHCVRHAFAANVRYRVSFNELNRQSIL